MLGTSLGRFFPQLTHPLPTGSHISIPVLWQDTLPVSLQTDYDLGWVGMYVIRLALVTAVLLSQATSDLALLVPTWADTTNNITSLHWGHNKFGLKESILLFSANVLSWSWACKPLSGILRNPKGQGHWAPLGTSHPTFLLSCALGVPMESYKGKAFKELLPMQSK